MRKIVSEQAASQVRGIRNRQESRRNIKKYAKPLLNNRTAKFPTENNSPDPRQVGWKLLQTASDRIVYRNAALIRFIWSRSLRHRLATKLQHELLRWTLKMRKYRFPKSSAKKALKMINDYSKGESSRNSATSWIKGCTYLPDYLNGPLRLPVRRTKKGNQNRRSYKNMVFQAGLYYTAQYDVLPKRAVELTVLAAAVNIRDQDPVRRHTRCLKKLPGV